MFKSGDYLLIGRADKNRVNSFGRRGCFQIKHIMTIIAADSQVGELVKALG